MAVEAATGEVIGAEEAYPDINGYNIRCLEQFLFIDSGDLMLLSTYERHYEVYLGIVVPPRNPAHRSGTAYFYHYDIAAGDWPTGWTSTGPGRFLTFDIPEIGAGASARPAAPRTGSSTWPSRAACSDSDADRRSPVDAKGPPRWWPLGLNAP